MTLTLTATPKQYEDVPRILLNLTSSPLLNGALTMTRIHSDGSRYPVLTESRPTLVGSWLGYDFHMPFNEDVRYEAEVGSLSDMSPTVSFASAGVTWLIDPTDPELSVPVDRVVSVGDATFSSPATRYQVHGQRLPTFRRDRKRGGEQGELQIYCGSVLSWKKAWDLLEYGGPILLNIPHSNFLLKWKWIQPGDLSLANPSPKESFDARIIRLPYEQCVQPGATVLDFTYAELAADFPTYADVVAHYATYGDMKVDART